MTPELESGAEAGVIQTPAAHLAHVESLDHRPERTVRYSPSEFKRTPSAPAWTICCAGRTIGTKKANKDVNRGIKERFMVLANFEMEVQE
jgi:hypothetical protein